MGALIQEKGSMLIVEGNVLMIIMISVNNLYLKS